MPLLAARSRWLALGAAYGAAALVVYRRALPGGLVSDDVAYLANPWVRHPGVSAIAALLDPGGAPAAHTANYAPLTLLAHAAALRAFGDAWPAHHALQVLLHAACATAIAALLARAGLAFAAAAFLGAIFLVHPAAVEAVAWLSQLKSVLGLGLACAALLLEPRRPAGAAAAFTAALLAKFQAAFALPVAAVAVALAPAGAARRRRALWLAAWAAALAAVAVPQLAAFERLGHAVGSGPEGALARGLFLLALLGRYAAMAATGWGVSAFHEPAPPAGVADGWVLLGLAVAVAATARGALVLARREPEALFWVWAAAALVPVSQLLPFRYPMADRYLYFALPGLLGALGLALRAPLARWLAAAPRARPALAAAALALLAAFALRSEARAPVWRSDLALARDAAAHYPDGLPAWRLRAAAAAVRGDPDGVVAALRAAHARGFDRFLDLERDPLFAPLRDDARFRAVVADVAGTWIAAVAPRRDLTAPELLMLGQAHRARGEWDLALARLAEAAADPGPTGPHARAELAATRAARLRARPGGEDRDAGDGG